MYERYYLSTICREPGSGTPLLPGRRSDGQSFHGGSLSKVKIGMLQMRNNGIGIFLCAQVATKDCAGAFRPHLGRGLGRKPMVLPPRRRGRSDIGFNSPRSCIRSAS
ncbi:hypothetical protein RHEC894_PD00060 (plasmid) [Rhizobium sp. CIAT894]|nr:hypothetical protein RHEC894_PD00060 [Rhizobium sp. CIAT894]